MTETMTPAPNLPPPSGEPVSDMLAPPDIPQPGESVVEPPVSPDSSHGDIEAATGLSPKIAEREQRKEEHRRQRPDRKNAKKGAKRADKQNRVIIKRQRSRIDWATGMSRGRINKMRPHVSRREGRRRMQSSTRPAIGETPIIPSLLDEQGIPMADPKKITDTFNSRVSSGNDADWTGVSEAFAGAQLHEVRHGRGYVPAEKLSVEGMRQFLAKKRVELMKNKPQYQPDPTRTNSQNQP